MPDPFGGPALFLARAGLGPAGASAKIEAMSNYLGIEIGATKLQLGIGHGDGPPMAAFERLDARRDEGAAGIRRQIAEAGRRLIDPSTPGPSGSASAGRSIRHAGRTITSHQVDGLGGLPAGRLVPGDVPLPAAARQRSGFGRTGGGPFRAGRGGNPVFYLNVGSGIGGALVVGGQLYTGGQGIACELGHLRPGPEADPPERTVESAASGFGLAAAPGPCFRRSRTIPARLRSAALPTAKWKP